MSLEVIQVRRKVSGWQADFGHASVPALLGEKTVRSSCAHVIWPVRDSDSNLLEASKNIKLGNVDAVLWQETYLQSSLSDFSTGATQCQSR